MSLSTTTTCPTPTLQPAALPPTVEELRAGVRAMLFNAVVLSPNDATPPDFGLTKTCIQSNASTRGKHRFKSNAVPSSSPPLPVMTSAMPQQQHALLGEHTTTTTDAEMGGWLRRSTKQSKGAGKHFGETLYFVVNDTRGYFCPIRNGELIEEDLIPFHKMVAVSMHYCQEFGHYYFQVIWVCGPGGKLRQGDFAPANTRDRELVTAWTCALQFRSKTYEASLDQDRERAIKLALWCQSLYRGIQGRRIAGRRRQRVNSLKRGTLSRMVSGLLYDKSTSNATHLNPSQSNGDEDEDGEEEESSSSSEEEDLDLMDPTTQRRASASSLPSITRSNSSSLYAFTKSLLPRRLTTSSATTTAASPSNNNNSSGKSVRSTSSLPSTALVVPANSLPPTDSASAAAAAGEEEEVVEQMEDEIWENQRWQSIAFRGTTQVRGWSDAALLPTDRGPFSDRLGLLSFPSLDAIGLPQRETGWKVTTGWTLDSEQCNSEGWTYAQTFGALDSNLASGREYTSASPRWLVRRRRWYRVRTRRVKSNVRGEEELFAISGWLGMQGMMTGRWTNHFAFIPAKSRQREGQGPAICLFKDSVRLFDYNLEFRLNFSSLSKRDVKVKHLDNLCRVSDACATQDRPGLFHLYLTGEAEPRVLNAHSSEARVRWVALLHHCIESSPAPDYETIVNRRSMRKGAVWEFSRATYAVKGVVGEVKTQFKRVMVGGAAIGSATIGGGSSFEQPRPADIDPDAALIAQLREEHRNRYLPPPPAMPSSPTAATAAADANPDELDLNDTSGAQGAKPTLARPGGGGGGMVPPTPSMLKNFKLLPPPIKKMMKKDGSTMVLATSLPNVSRETAAVMASVSGEDTSGSGPPSLFEPPPNYENLCLDVHFELNVDDLDTILFREEEFTRDILDFEKMTDVEMESWTNGIEVGSEHRRKYKMPRVGVVPPGPSLHQLTRVQTCPGFGYVVDHVVSTPDVPFGGTFNVEFRYVLIGEGNQRVRLIISQKVTIFKSTMAQSFIRSGTKREIGNYYKGLWPTFFRRWLVQKRRHLLGGDAAAAVVAVEALGAAKTEAAQLEHADASTTGAANQMGESRLVLALLLLSLLLLANSIYLTYRMARLEDLLASRAG